MPRKKAEVGRMSGEDVKEKAGRKKTIFDVGLERPETDRPVIDRSVIDVPKIDESEKPEFPKLDQVKVELDFFGFKPQAKDKPKEGQSGEVV